MKFRLFPLGTFSTLLIDIFGFSDAIWFFFFYKRAYYDKDDDLSFANGACGLLKQEKYPGYCQLCFIFHSEESENFGRNGYTVEFLPLLTKEGERILIKYDHDCCMCSVETGQIDYEEYYNTGIKKWSGMTLTIFNKGVCKMWDKD